MSTVRRSELRALLERIQHATMLTIIARTVPELRKTAPDGTVCPFWTAYKAGRLVKLAGVNGVTYFVWARMVNKRRLSEGLSGDFESMPRKWGHRLPGSALVEHTTKEGEQRTYLEIAVNKSLGYSYWLDGRKIDAEKVNKFLAPVDRAGRTGLRPENAPILRDYNLANILNINVTLPGDAKGERYAVVDG